MPEWKDKPDGEGFDVALAQCYEALAVSEVAHDYHVRHGTESKLILTVYDDERAAGVAGYLADRIRGKTVIEIGGGIGLLAIYLSEYAGAERVYAIESDPSWTSTFLATLYARKPKNVTWIYGAAEEMVGQLRGDVALFCTHSACHHMAQLASQFAPVVIDVYGELVGHHALRSELNSIPQPPSEAK
jgi:SAM-dependent methyltransferase